MDADTSGMRGVAGDDADAAQPRASASEVPGAQALSSLRSMMNEVQATALAFAALARSEVQLSLALLLRAALLAAIGLLTLGLAVVLGCALLVALCLAMGLSWPTALAVSLALLLVVTVACWQQAARRLRACGLPHTRAQLAALWPERAP